MSAPTCEYCKLGWPLHLPISQSQEGRHSYPQGYRGLHVGFGPYCADNRSRWDEAAGKWVRP